MSDERPDLLEPRMVRGFRDLFGDTLVPRRTMIDAICRVYELYGFTPLETPALEPADVLGKFLPDSETPEEGIYALKDPDDERWIALRYDLTAPLSRVFAMHRQQLGTPYRRYQVGPVYRYEKRLKPGRFREFFQVDFDTVGAAGMAADAEACSVLADAMEAVGIPRGDYTIRVNNRKVLRGLLEALGLPESGGKTIEVNKRPVEQATIVLRALDKLEQVGLDGVTELLGQGRKDPSGDFTAGAQLDDAAIGKLVEYLELGEQAEGPRGPVLDPLEALVAGSEMGTEGVEELREIDAILEATGFDEQRVSFDPTIVRGLGYYTGPVYEAELTFQIKDPKTGQKRRFGSVGGGGRYDGLVERFLGERVPATGASVGVDRLLAALQVAGRAGAADRVGPVVVTAMDGSRIAEYARMVAELRQAGIAAEMFVGHGGFKKQLKYADRRRAPVAVIAGGDEFERGEVTLKDLRLGTELAAEITDRDEWRKGQPAQVSVPRDRLVEEVRAILARHAPR